MRVEGRATDVRSIDDVLHRERFKAILLDQGQERCTEQLLRPPYAPVISSRFHQILTSRTTSVRSFQNRQIIRSCAGRTEPNGLKSDLRKYEAEAKLQAIIRGENGKIGSAVPVLQADDSVTFDWFVKEKYLPIRCGRWRPATREKTEHEINKYLVEKFKNVPLRQIGLFELQTRLNDLAEGNRGWVRRSVIVWNPPVTRSWTLQMTRNRRIHD